MKSKLPASLLLTASLFISASAFAQVPTASFSVGSGTVCTKASVQITDMSANAPTAWSYSVNGTATSTLQNPEITFTGSGTYSIDLEATNGSGTSAVYTETVLVQPLPTITVSGSTLVCTAASSTLSASGADTYTWDSGSAANTVTINPTANTIYTVVGTSTLTGCSDSSFVSVFTVPLPTISVSDATICSGQSFTIVPSGASTYSYPGGSAIVSPTATTSYTVSGTDALTGCSDSTSISISVNSVAIAVAGGSICAGESFTLMPSGASTYTYSGGSNVVSPAVNTTYTVTGMDAATGCSDSVAVTIGVSASPTITVNSGSICAGSVFSIQPAGASNYTFSSGSATVAPLTNTTYVVSGIDPVTGCTGFANLTLTVNPLPVIMVNSGTICAGDSFTLMPSGAATYTFSNGSSTVAPSVTTNYSVTGTDAGGCVSQSAAVATVIVAGTKPTVSISSSQGGVICSGETIVLTASGAGTYSWSTGVATSMAVINPTITTLFYVTGTDVLSGCSGYASLLQYVSECTGVAQVADGIIEVNVYPNPTYGELTIEAAQEISLSVVNTLGQEILKQQLSPGKNILHLDEQPEGIYFVNLKQNNTVKTVRIIKH